METSGSWLLSMSTVLVLILTEKAVLTISCNSTNFFKSERRPCSKPRSMCYLFACFGFMLTKAISANYFILPNIDIMLFLVWFSSSNGAIYL